MRTRGWVILAQPRVRTCKIFFRHAQKTVIFQQQDITSLTFLQPKKKMNNFYMDDTIRGNPPVCEHAGSHTAIHKCDIALTLCPHCLRPKYVAMSWYCPDRQMSSYVWNCMQVIIAEAQNRSSFPFAVLQGDSHFVETRMPLFRVTWKHPHAVFDLDATKWGELCKELQQTLDQRFQMAKAWENDSINAAIQQLRSANHQGLPVVPCATTVERVSTSTDHSPGSVVNHTT